MFEIRLLGQFNVRLDGKPVEIPSRPAQSLLAYLSLTSGVAHRRERLAGLLWPDVPEVDARRSLRGALWHLRRAAAGQTFLRADDITVALDPRPDVWVDAVALTQKVPPDQPIDDLIGVVSAYGGELLPGFYDEWIIIERERLQMVFETRMKLLLDRLLEARCWEEAAEWGERWIALAGSSEPAYRALMIAYSGQGDLLKVGQTYKRCMKALSQDLGMEPSADTRKLYLKILREGQEPLAETPPGPDDAIPPVSTVEIDQATSTGPEGTIPAQPPFKGLLFFDEADARLFFGREAWTDRLLERLGIARPGQPSGDNLLFVIGASGSGKSSLVRAGLVPALRQAVSRVEETGPGREPAWDIQVITPSNHPIESLAISLTQEVESVTAAATLTDDLGHDPRSLRLYLRKMPAPLFLIVDQMEEVFTLCRSVDERRMFFDNLLSATEGDRCKVVLTLRADFYAHCAEYENLRLALAASQEYIGPMSAVELRRAIEEPARAGGYAFEPGLVDLIMRDAGGEPGSLPLLSHALLETWKRRDRRTLTLAGYAESGGVHGAIAHSAESVFASLSPSQQRIARNIFLRLTQLGEGESAAGIPAPDTRRRVALQELVSRPEDRGSIDQVIQLLASARLVTMGEGTVEVAHEALIREWPALRLWLSENREGLRLHRRLTQAAQSWEELERDPGELLRGARLDQALEWAAGHDDALNALEREFLQASISLAEAEASEREAQRQRELEAARTLAREQELRLRQQVRAARQLRRGAVALALALAAALALAGIALYLNKEATANAKVAEERSQIAASRELAAAAVGQLDNDPQLSILLALQALDRTHSAGLPPLVEAQEGLHRAVETSRLQHTLRPEMGEILGLALSPDGKRLAAIGASGIVRLWEVATGKELLAIHANTPGNTLNRFISFSPDGEHIATPFAGYSVKVWDAFTGEELLRVASPTGDVLAVVYSPDGARLATAGMDGVVKIWDANTGQELLSLPQQKGPVNDVAFSPDGARLATANTDGTAILWDTATGQALLTLTSPDTVSSLAFSPDGKRLATGNYNTSWSLWDTTTGEALVTSFGGSSLIEQVVFDPTGKYLATAGEDGKARLWEAATGRELLSLSGHTSGVLAVAFRPDGQQLFTSSRDETVKFWDLSPKAGSEWLTLAGHTDRVYSVAYSPDGTRLATSSFDGTVKVWDASTGKEVYTFGGANGTAVAFGPDGRRLYTINKTADDRRSIQVWDLSTGKALASFPCGHCSWLAVSPDGTLLAVNTDEQGNGMLLDASTGKELVALTGHTAVIQDLAFSPDGTRLATGAADGTARIWEIATRSEGGVATIWEQASGKNQGLHVPNQTVFRVAFNPDTSLLAASGNDAQIHVFNGQTHAPLFDLSGHTGTTFGVAFSPDGRYLATSSTDATVKIWDVSARTSAVPLTLYGHTAAIYRVVFSPDGKRLATASRDGASRVYALDINDLIAIAKSRLTRWFTSDECLKFLHQAECPPSP